MSEDNRSSDAQWFVARGSNKIGPYSIEILRKALTNGVLRSTDLAWSEIDPTPISILEVFAAHPDLNDITADDTLNLSDNNAIEQGQPGELLSSASPADGEVGGTAKSHESPSASVTTETPTVESAPVPRDPIVRTWNDYTRSHKDRDLRDWALIPSGTAHKYDEREYKNVYDALKELALPERWQIGEGRVDRRWPLLQRYVYYTFERLRREKEQKIFYLDRDGQKWAVFNTGLVDRVYNPIYMLFQANPKFVLNDAYPPWKIWNICTYAQKREGKKLADLFRPCPSAARYLQDASDLIIPPGEVPEFDEEHIIFDAIADDRYPPEFLLRFKPSKLEWQDYTKFEDGRKKRRFLKEYRDLLEYDPETNPMRLAILNRVKDAALLACKRTFWNYKTAIPAYYPALDQLNLLLPLCLDDRDETKVTIAMVVSKTRAGAYTAWTVFPLQWAYERARVVCRPDSDWLVPDRIDLRDKISSNEAQINTD